MQFIDFMYSHAANTFIQKLEVGLYELAVGLYEVAVGLSEVAVGIL